MKSRVIVKKRLSQMFLLIVLALSTGGSSKSVPTRDISFTNQSGTPPQACLADAYSGIVVVNLAIVRISQIDDLDFWVDQADFWARVTITDSFGNAHRIDSDHWENQDDVSPNWRTPPIQVQANKPIDISVKVIEGDWPCYGEPEPCTEVDVHRDKEDTFENRAFTMKLSALPGKTYSYISEGSESGRRARIDLKIELDDWFVHVARSEKEVLQSFHKITQQYDGPWAGTVWGGSGSAMQAAWSEDINKAAIKLTVSVAMSGLLSPLAEVGGHIVNEIASELLQFLMDEYLEYLYGIKIPDPPKTQYLGTTTVGLEELRANTRNLRKDLRDLITSCDEEFTSYQSQEKISNTTKKQLDLLNSSIEKATLISAKLESIMAANENARFSYQLFDQITKYLTYLQKKKTLLRGTFATPNLTVSSITASQPGAQIGKEIEVAAKVINNGLSLVPQYKAKIELFDNNIKVAEAVNDLEIGLCENGAVNCIWIKSWKLRFSSAGTHNLRAVIDAPNRVDECIETDNEKTVSVIVAPLPPDLIVSNVHCTNSPLMPGKEAFFEVNIRNTGGSPASSSGYASYNVVINGMLAASHRGGPGMGILDPGKSWTAIFSYTFKKEGEYRLAVSVDSENKVVEHDESNNGLSVTIKVNPSPLPDLVVGIIKYSSPVAGYPVDFGIQIENKGESPAPETGYGSYDVEIDGIIAYSPRRGPGLGILPPHQSTIHKFSHTFSEPGSHTLKIRVDPDNNVPEISETNNENSVIINVLSPALSDLVIRSLNFEYPPALGKQVSIVAVIENVGDSTALAIGSNSYDLYVNNSLYESHRGRPEESPLRPGEARSIKVLYIFKELWTHNFRFVIDPENKVNEKSESNNVRSLSVSIRPPQLPVTRGELRTSKSRYDAGENVMIIFTNTGETVINLSNAAPLTILDGVGRTIFRPISLQVLTPVSPGERKTWIWSQRDDSNRLVRMGSYRVDLQTLNAGVFRADFQILGSYDVERVAPMRVNRAPQFLMGVQGPGFASPEIAYSYSIAASDLEGDRLKYMFDWGDGTSSITDWVNSGIPVRANHGWRREGNYMVRVKTMDSKGAESQWSVPLVVRVTRMPARRPNP